MLQNVIKVEIYYKRKIEKQTEISFIFFSPGRETLL